MATICNWTLNELIDELDNLKIKGSQCTKNNTASYIDIDYYFPNGAQTALLRMMSMHANELYSLNDSSNIKYWVEAYPNSLWGLQYSSGKELINTKSAAKTAQNIKDYCDKISTRFETVFKAAQGEIPAELSRLGFEPDKKAYSKFMDAYTTYTLEVNSTYHVEIQTPFVRSDTSGYGMLDLTYLYTLHDTTKKVEKKTFNSLSELQNFLLGE